VKKIIFLLNVITSIHVFHVILRARPTQYTSSMIGRRKMTHFVTLWPDRLYERL